MKYFLPPYTEAHINSQFKKLAKTLHPDKGGSAKQFTELTEEKNLLLAYSKMEIKDLPVNKLKRKSGKPVIFFVKARAELKEMQLRAFEKRLDKYINTGRDLLEMIKKSRKL